MSIGHLCSSHAPRKSCHWALFVHYIEICGSLHMTLGVIWYISQHLGRSLGGGNRDSFGPLPLSTTNAIFSPHVV